ncbi:MAG: imidazolonepropionase [Gammaproteobacteria bacterium]|jgi:imidazolonepropionase|nr:imidazolonepropionase [Gammaproteobacteria bacterium]
MPVLTHIEQLATCPPENPQSDAGLISDAAIAWTGDTIRWVGRRNQLPAEFNDETQIDGKGRLVIPGLIDCHTHLCFGGWRGDEFDLRISGASYQEIAAAGGGIASTVSATRAAEAESLLDKAGDALDRMLSLGVTSVECKSGYGLDEVNELKQLSVYQQLDSIHVIDLFPTFLGAHIVPPEYSSDRDRYIRLICEKLIPVIANQGLARFCDVFVEQGAYTVDEGRQILMAASEHGLQLKVHADQLSDGGGALLAAEVGAVSAEHLEYISAEGIEALSKSGTVAVSLPLASLYLAEPYLPARKLLDAGIAVAVATDFNPGSAPSYHLPLALTLACLNQRMTPQEALNGATTVAARAVSAQHRIGSLTPGFRADLAIINAPSLNQWLYHFVPNACTGVIKNGEWVVNMHDA